MSEQMDTDQPSVRFSSETEEIGAPPSLEQVATLTNHNEREDMSPEAKQELRSLAVTMQVGYRDSPRIGRVMCSDADLPRARKPACRTSPMSPSHYLFPA